MGLLNFTVVKQHVLKRLENELPAQLYYHSIGHTQHDVLPHALRLGSLTRLAEEDLLLLQTAAVYHDIGYVQQYADHEAVGAEIARKELPRFGYSPSQIDQICAMILATKIPQTATTLLEKLLCDADMDSLGRQDFFMTSHNLRYELYVMLDLYVPLQDWYVRQLHFLQQHQYWTAAAIETREATKQQNIREIRTLLASVVES